MAKWILTALVVVLLLSNLGSPVTTAQAPVAGGVFAPGKAAVVVANNNVAATLENVQVRMLGSRAFLVGDEVKGSFMTKSMFGGAGKTWVPVDAITSIGEMELRNVRPDDKKDEK